MFKIKYLISSLLLISSCYTSLTYSVGLSGDTNSLSNILTNKLNQANNALQITYKELAAYYTNNDDTIAPENFFQTAGGLFQSITNDKYGAAVAVYKSSGVPSCLAGQTIKLVPRHTTNEEGDTEVDYAIVHCITTIDNGEGTSCQVTSFKSDTEAYAPSPTLMGTDLIDCRSVSSEDMGETPSDSTPEEADDTDSAILSGQGTGLDPDSIYDNIDNYNQDNLGDSSSSGGRAVDSSVAF